MPDTVEFEVEPVAVVLPKRQLVPTAVRFTSPLKVIDEKAIPPVYECPIEITLSAFDSGKAVPENVVAPIKLVLDVTNPKSLVVNDADGQPIAVDLEAHDEDIAKAFAAVRQNIAYINRRFQALGKNALDKVAPRLPPEKL